MSKVKIIHNLVHEIRSPLFNIKSFLETLYEYYFQLTDSQILEFLEIANQETVRLVKLSSTSLELSKVNSQMSVLHSTLCLKQLIKQVTKSYDITRRHKNISFYVKTPLSFPRVIASYDFSLQVLTNLINNSLKFTYPFGVIVVKLRILNSMSIKSRKKSFLLRIDIVDNGIGISKKNIKLLFNRFKQVSKPKYYAEGLGLGLSIVKELMEVQSKHIILISTINRGTCVILNF
uniref:histidine kinase n=1 Tax=Chroomonas mesostigmatica CCMP1168 TaxID=1195612 RepID=A0A248SPW9_9CRYP|nr:two-component sensor kinase [Chroomonas mesostigmatica CCMP1168]